MKSLIAFFRADMDCCEFTVKPLSIAVSYDSVLGA